MDETKAKIVELFKQKGSELSTNDILFYVYPELKEVYEKVERTDNKNLKRKIAQAHRKLLYHINYLVECGILRFSKFGEKGLKFFVLNIGDNEELSEINPNFKKRVIITKPVLPVMPIESYEHKGIVIKYEFLSWIDKLNALVLMCDRIKNVKEFEKIFESALNVINDSLCLENFDIFLERINYEGVFHLIEKLNSICENFRKKVNLILNLKNLNEEKFVKLIEEVFSLNLRNTFFIYSFNLDELHERASLVKKIISFYIKKKDIMYIKNKNIQKAPWFLGVAGPYSILESEWESFISRNKNILSFGCAQSSLIVDVEKFYLLYGLNNIKFSELMFNISKSFLSANSIQRRKSQEYFREIISFDKENEREFLEVSRNYIRFWNFGLSTPEMEPRNVLNIVNEAKKRVNHFSIAEETIYKSCGMPVRFKIALSCAFKESNPNLSPAKYKKIEINSFEDLYKPKLKKEVLEREEVTGMFDGGNDITFHRNGNFGEEDIIREINFIMGSFNLPFFSYNFAGLKGDMKITSYF